MLYTPSHTLPYIVYARVADIYQYAGTDETGAGIVKILYGFNDNSLLTALGLTKDGRYAPADCDGKLYYTADTLLTALRNGLDKHPTTVKNALETIVKTNGTAMPETDSYGHSEAKNLDLGLYLMVETRVPEMVTETTAPFLISLPMTNAEGTEWMYDLTIYPKNGTSNPDLEKLVKEDENSTGKKDFDHKATASAGDTVDYRCRYSESPCLPVLLGYFHPPNGIWTVTPVQYGAHEFIPVFS